MNTSRAARNSRLRMNAEDDPASDGQAAWRTSLAILAIANPLVTLIALTRTANGGFLDLTGLAVRQWPSWLVSQSPFAIGLGLTTAGAYLTWRDRYTAHWRDREAKQASQRAIRRAKRALDKATSGMPAATSIDNLKLSLGINTSTAKRVMLDAAALRTHAVVVGPTGLGKTQALQRLAWTLTAQPSAHSLVTPLVLIDMKGGIGLHTWIDHLATHIRRDFHLITIDPNTSRGHNPLANQIGDEIADTVYEITFADYKNLHLHYATLSRRLLQIGAQTLVDLSTQGITRPGTGGRPWTPTLEALVELLNLSRLKNVSDLTTPAMQARIDRYLADVTSSKAATDIGDIRDRLAVITKTASGAILDRPDGLDLRAAIEAGDITCFSLDAAGSSETARTLGHLAVHDLSGIFSTLGAVGWGQTHMCPVILDEFPP